MSRPVASEHVEAIRRFNRWYTQRVGALRGDLLATPYPLPQARVLFELAHRDGITAADLAAALDLDRSYLSRLLAGLEKKGLVLRARDKADGRRQSLALTAAGRRAFAELDRRSRDEVHAILSPLSPEGERRLLGAMAAIEHVLGDADGDAPPFTLRAHEPGDLGWVVSRHGALYAREYGWDATFEALVADIAAKFLREFDPARERAWIAERDGERVGCVFVVAQSESVAKLRMLLVEPEMRGLGLGRRLVAECIRFARSVGYRELVLWTNDVLHAARHLYVESGFTLVGEQRHTSFGHALVGQTWSLHLDNGAGFESDPDSRSAQKRPAW
jgi:DNA-binding MarR family transcriptional regulator/N-acetylglutamate synthase-like GNAT family acetyltransferase